MDDHPSGIDHRPYPAEVDMLCLCLTGAQNLVKGDWLLGLADDASTASYGDPYCIGGQRTPYEGKPSADLLMLKESLYLRDGGVHAFHDTEEAGIEPAAAFEQPTVLKTAGATRPHQLPGGVTTCDDPYHWCALTAPGEGQLASNRC